MTVGRFLSLYKRQNYFRIRLSWWSHDPVHTLKHTELYTIQKEVIHIVNDCSNKVILKKQYLHSNST